jgi:hypothetical protein
MPTLDVTQNYQDGQALTQGDLDNMATSIEDFINSTKLDADNLQDGAVATDNLADGAVTQAKRAALGQQISTNGSSTFTTTSTTPVDVTGMTLSITTTGRPVWVGLIADPDNASLGSTVGISANTGFYIIKRGATIVSTLTISVTAIPCGAVWHIDTPAAGTYTYKLQANVATTGTLGATYCKLVAYEL